MPVTTNDSAGVISGFTWVDGGAAGTPITITYRFALSASEYTLPAAYTALGYSYDYIGSNELGVGDLDANPLNGVQQTGGPATLTALNSAQRAMAMDALQQWANVANITINPTEAPAGEGNFRFMFSSNLGSNELAHAYYPESPLAGDVWLNSAFAAEFSSTNAGSEAHETLLHEIGHGLGLKHPFDMPYPDGTGGSLGYNGSLIPYSSEAATTKYTVMAYADYVGAYDGTTIYGGTYFFPTTPMLLDIYAIQYLYGANMSYHAGDDVYEFVDANYYQTIWDAGGTDTLKWSGTGPSEIDLRAGEFSDLGESIIFYGANAPLSQSDTVAIAYNVVIENAVGGNWNDTIYGNQVANNIDGRDGADRIDGYGGNDVIQGGLGDDIFRVSRGNGFDTIVDAGGTDALAFVGTTGDIRLRRTGDDLLVFFANSSDGALVTSYFTTAFGPRPVEEIRFVSANAWTGTTTWSHSDIVFHLNTAPVVNAPATQNAVIGTGYVGLQGLVQVTDGNGDTMSKFEVRDANASAGSGVIYYGGQQAQGATVTVNAATLADVYVGNASAIGHNVFELRAFDGLDWSAWTSFDLNTRNANRAPVVTPMAATQSVVQGGGVSATQFFTVTDPDGDFMTKFEFYDGGAGGGFFKLNGVTQSALTVINVTTANLSGIAYFGGAAAGSETLYVRAFDGELWSDWASWTQQSLRATNARPVVNTQHVKNTTQGAYTNLATFVSATDADGDAMVSWHVRDSTNTAGSGLLYANGALQAQGATVTVTDLSTVYVQGGANPGHDNIEIQAYDGYEWSNWAVFDLNTRLPNRAPVVTPVSAVQSVPVNGTVYDSSLFSISDADGDAMVRYEFYDAGAGGGHFFIGGVHQPDLTVLSLEAGTASVLYFGGSGPGRETLYVRAYDGFEWSAWSSWTQRTTAGASNAAPVVSAPAVKNTTQGTWNQATTFLSVTDADLDPIVKYEVQDLTSTGGTGVFYANGAVQLQGATVVTTSGDLSGIYFQGGASLGTDQFRIRAYDGETWGNWTTFDLVTRLPNRAPVVTPSSAVQGVAANGSVQASSLFGIADADGDAMIRYEFYDLGLGGGHFDRNGVNQAEQAVLSVEASALSSFSYEGGATPGRETLYVRAYDGEAWSDWKSWTGRTTAGASNAAPVVNAPAVKNTTQGTWNQFSAFLSTSDADLDPMVKFEVQDMSSAAGSGLLYANGVVQAQGATVTTTTGDLSSIYVQGGASLGTEQVRIRAYDGETWGNWTTFDLVTRLPNRAPVVTPTAGTQGVVIGSSVQASTLFGITDADGDAMQRYEFYDLGLGGGRFQVSGVNQAAQTVISVSASDLGNVTYAAGAATGTEALYVRAWDGEAWSDWKSWNEMTLRPTNVLPVINAPAVKNSDVNAWTQVSTFVTVTDADRDPMAMFEIRDLNGAAGSAYFYANGAEQAQGATVLVNAADLTGVYVRGGTAVGTNNFEIRANDGYGWSAWEDFTLNTRLPNVAPTLSVQAFATGYSSPVKVSSLFLVQDPNGDVPEYYQLHDLTAGGTSGYFIVNGQVKAQNTTLTITAAELSSTYYVGGTAPDAETLYIRAYDGQAWSEWANLQMSTGTLSRYFEVLGTANNDMLPGFGAHSQDGNVYFGLQGNDTFNAESPFPLGYTVNSNFYVGGSGGDRYNVGAGDTFSFVVENGNSAGDVLSAGTFRFNDPAESGAGIVDGRHLFLGNFNQQAPFDLSATIIFDWEDPAHRIETYIVGGVSYTYDQFRSAIYASNPEVFTYADLGLGDAAGFLNEEVRYYETRSNDLSMNHLPVITATAGTVTPNRTVQASTLFSASDSDGDAILRYQITDTGASGGTLRYDGNVVTVGTLLDIQASDLSRVTYVTGAQGTIDTLTVRARDSENWGAATTLTLQSVNRAPTVSATSTGVREGVPVLVQSLFSTTDADGDTLTQYEFTDLGAGGGTLKVNGVTQGQAPVVVTAANLGQVTYTGGAAGSSDTLRIRVYDGTDWSAPLDRNLVPLVDHAPTITLSSFTRRAAATVDGVDERARLDAVILTKSDADGDAITLYEFTDNGAGGGYLLVNGVVQAANTPVVIAAADLTNAWYVGDLPGQETLTVRASDGYLWSSPVSTTMTTVLNQKPVVSGTNFTSTPGKLLFTSEFFSVADPDANPITRIDVRAPVSFSGFGTANGFDAGDPTTAHIESFQTFGFSTPLSDGVYLIEARAFDGVDWSDWKSISFTVATPADGAGNDVNHARAITLTSTPQVFQDWVGYTDLNDFYKFTVDGSQRVVIAMDPADYGKSRFIQLFDAQGNAEMTTIVAGPNAVSFTTASLEAGDYYLQVSGGSSSYNLSLSSQAGTPYDGAGGSYATARMLTNLHAPQTFRDYGAGSPGPYDYDYYGFTLAPGETLTYDLDGVTGTGTSWIISLNIDNHQNTNGGYAGSFGEQTVYPFQGYTWVYGTPGGSSLEGTITNNNAFSQSYFFQIAPYQGSSNYTLTMSTNNLPKFNGGQRSAYAGEVIAGTSLFNTADADLDVVTQVRLIDNNAAADSGYFTLDGVQQAAGVAFSVNTADLGLLQFHAGSATGYDDIAASGYDGRAWGLWWHWNIDTLAAPADQAGNDFANGRQVALSPTLQTFTDWVGNSDGVDIYTFTYNGDQPFRMRYVGGNPDATVRIELHRNAGGTDGGIAQGAPAYVDATGSTAADIMLTPLVAGTYSVQLTQQNGTNTQYSLTLSTT